MVNDPSATLLHVNGDAYLAIVLISAIKVGMRSISALSLEELHEPNIEISFQLLTLVPHIPTTDDCSDWLYDLIPPKLPSSQSILCTAGSLFEATNPLTVISKDSKPMFHFSTNKLLVITEILHECAMVTQANIVTISESTVYPYRVEGIISFKF
jgi:hypothetical protein